MNPKQIRILAIILILSGILIGLHQQITWGYFFEIRDIHHELFISSAIFAGILLYLTTSKRKRK